ncbi:MAG TPA: alpha-N-arabinofuranosidase [Propionibacteriaceae bacterium]|nr:alpha-N-arabinofuranosidase [Propionibacteriaceae bacterium]
MRSAHLVLDPSFVTAPVSPRLFGAFVEHMGRCVYTGIYEPDHPQANGDGFRTDVLDLVRELGVTIVRYPGGNFVSGYRWEDGVGPLEQRPKRLDPAWRAIESNAFGLGEFMRWAAQADVEPMLALNLGTRGLQEALDLLEYCNHTGGTYLSELRRQHGSPEPYKVRMWCLGNEMDGPWQLGHKSAEDYGRLASGVARGMRQFDSNLELVVCGSSGRQMPTFGGWEATVLEQSYDEVDFISAHAYYENLGDIGSFLASSVDMEDFITDVIATADHLRGKLKRSKRISISFDEWNVWYLSRVPEQVAGGWEEVRRVSEDAYTVADAVVVGSLLITLLRHSDRVKCACLAQLVNAISVIRSEPGGPAWRQTTFHPFALTARHAKGDVLEVALQSPTYETKQYGTVPVVDATATHDPATGQVSLFAVNRSDAEPVTLEVDLRALPALDAADAFVLSDPDLSATNSQDHPDRVQPRSLAVHSDGSVLRLQLPAVSWSCVHLTRAYGSAPVRR